MFSGKNGKGKHEDLEQSKEAQCSSRVRRMAKELVYIYIYIYIYFIYFSREFFDQFVPELVGLFTRHNILIAFIIHLVMKQFRNNSVK